jgi:Fe-S oxidoreductase
MSGLNLEGANIEWLINELKKSVGPDNVLTDAEDLYVYSFIGPLGLTPGKRPIAVMRLLSDKKAAEVIKLCESKGIQVVIRGEAGNEIEKISCPAILLDFTNPPDAKSLERRFRESKNEMTKETHRTINWFSVYESTLRNRLFYRCKDCARYGDTACSGFCPVGQFYNGVETWSSKGRLLLTRGLMEGALKPTKKLIDSLYTCAACGMCYAQCLGDSELELHRAIESARFEISKQGLTPEVFESLAETIVKGGTPYKVSLTERMKWLDELSDASLSERAKTLYWVGCTASYRSPDIAKSTVHILNKANVNFTMIGEDEGCCGLILIHGGTWKEAKKIATENVEKIRKTGAKAVVTGCAGCYYTFKRLYPELFNVRLPVKLLHTSQFIEHLVKNGALEFRNLDLKATWHDPCSLGRHCGVYEPPREVLKSIPGLQYSEMPLNKGYSRCCGGGGGLWVFNPKLALSISDSYLREGMSAVGVQAIVTGCPMCHMNLGYAARRLRQKARGFIATIYDLAEIVDKAST